MSASQDLRPRAASRWGDARARHFLPARSEYRQIGSFTGRCKAVAKEISAPLPRRRMSAVPSRSIAERKTQLFTLKRRVKDAELLNGNGSAFLAGWLWRVCTGTLYLKRQHAKALSQKLATERAFRCTAFTRRRQGASLPDVDEINVKPSPGAGGYNLMQLRGPQVGSNVASPPPTQDPALSAGASVVIDVRGGGGGRWRRAIVPAWPSALHRSRWP